eukprot:Em0020g994a
MENVHLLNSRTPAISASCLELKDILRECSTGKRILEVFPSEKAAASGTAEKNPKLHLDKDALSHKILWLRALADLYESQLPLFSTGSGQSFGRLEGSKVALFIETTEQLCRDESRLTSYKEAIGLLTREQLSGKETVQLFRFGSIVEPCSPGCLAFAADLESCFKFASEWTSSLASLGQDCNLLGALKVAAELATVDSACVVVATRPDQSADVVGDYMLNELTGRDSPKLHLVAFSDADASTYAVLKAIAEAIGGSYHGSFVKENPEVEDSEMMKLKGELQSVVMVLVGTPPSGHTFAHFLQLFFEEQLGTRQSFNIIRVGRWYDVWRKGLVVPSLDNLQEAWRHIMEDWAVNEHNCGVYLMLFHPPTDAMDGVCSYLEQKASGTAVGVAIIYYDVLEGRGGESAVSVLRKLASAVGGGRGRFHHFRGTGVGGSDDIDDIITELDRVKLFSETTVSCLPRHRPHSATPHRPHSAASHTTINPFATERLTRSVSFLPCCRSKQPPRQELFYLDRGLEKGIALDFGDLSIHKHKSKHVLIPDNEEPMASKEWLACYGTEALGLSCEKLTHNRQSAAYRHMDPQATLAAVPQQLRGLCQRLQWTLQRYQKRLHWLHAAKFCVSIPSGFNITVSIPSSFNIVAFATAAHLWQDKCIPISDESCTAAVRWVESLKDGGEVCLLEALWVALGMRPQGIYLVSNGTMTSTNDFLLDQLSFLREKFGHSWRLNTVSFCCQQGHHTWLPNEMQDDIKEWIKLRTTSHESDDVVLLVREIRLARNQLQNVKALLMSTGTCSGHYHKVS